MNLIIFNNLGEKEEEWNDITEITMQKNYIYVIINHCEPCAHRVLLGNRRFLITK